METMIYVIGSARGPKKVGLASSPAKRLKTLQTGNGIAVSVLYSRSVPREISINIERRAHWLLRERKAHGEWFQVGLAAAKAAVDQAVAERGEGEKASLSVGRKPLGVKETKMRLPIGLPERIDVLVGEQKRADFIRRALVEAVEREETARGIVPPKPEHQA